MSEEIIRVKSWEEFKQLAIKYHPKSFVYGIEQTALSPTKELTTLRLMLPTADGLYILLDFSNGKELRQTGIPIRVDKLGNHLIEDDDVKDFLKNQLKREDLQSAPIGHDSLINKSAHVLSRHRNGPRSQVFLETYVAEQSRETLSNAYWNAMKKMSASTIQMTWMKKSGETLDSTMILVPMFFQGHMFSIHFVTRSNNHLLIPRSTKARALQKFFASNNIWFKRRVLF